MSQPVKSKPSRSRVFRVLSPNEHSRPERLPRGERDDLVDRETPARRGCSAFHGPHCPWRRRRRPDSPFYPPRIQRRASDAFRGICKRPGGRRRVRGASCGRSAAGVLHVAPPLATGSQPASRPQGNRVRVMDETSSSRAQTASCSSRGNSAAIAYPPAYAAWMAEIPPGRYNGAGTARGACSGAPAGPPAARGSAGGPAPRRRRRRRRSTRPGCRCRRGRRAARRARRRGSAPSWCEKKTMP